MRGKGDENLRRDRKHADDKRRDRHGEIPVVAFLRREAAVGELRCGFQGFAPSFQMKQAFCVSFEIPRRGGETRRLWKPPRLHRVQTHKGRSFR
jgi:hypothetical protein